MDLNFDGAEIERIKDTLASILRSIGKFAMDTSEFPLQEFKNQLEEFAIQILIKRQSEDPTYDPDKNHRFIRNLVSEQRRVESRMYVGFKENSRQILTDFIKDLKKSLIQRAEGDNRIISNITEIEKAVDTSDFDAVRKATKTAGQVIRQIVEEQRIREKEQLSSLSTQLKSMREELRDTRTKMKTDPLTGIFNRQALDESLPKAISYSRLSGESMAVFLIDLDRFKYINDTFGHGAGDETLKSVAKSLVKSFFRKDDFAARYGGDEFIAYARNVNWEEAEKIAERTCRAIESLVISCGGNNFPITSSIGFTLMSSDDNMESIIARADEALYISKAEGRNKSSGVRPKDE
ncbi:MAG: diguanylate cyclase [Deltaproteobacteria bacterium]|nr:diguanylate cyclase [Deltaproteobacteria bacterium]